MASDESLLLAGSYARGESDEWSDVDLWVIGPEARPPQSFYSEDRLHVVSYYTVSDLNAEIRSPGSAPFVVPAIRQAEIILDPRDEAGTLKREAESWTWDLIEPLIPEWLGTQLIGMIEDAHKVRAAITTSDWDRGYDPLQVLIFGCTEAMIVGLGLLPETQNRYFAAVRTLLGSGHEWSMSLDMATGIRSAISIKGSMKAGLDLYASTVRQFLQTLPLNAARELETALARCCD